MQKMRLNLQCLCCINNLREELKPSSHESPLANFESCVPLYSAPAPHNVQTKSLFLQLLPRCRIFHRHLLPSRAVCNHLNIE